MLSPYLREQATIYDCRLSIINSYKLLLLLAVCLAAKAGTERERAREGRRRDRQRWSGERGKTQHFALVCAGSC